MTFLRELEGIIIFFFYSGRGSTLGFRGFEIYFKIIYCVSSFLDGFIVVIFILCIITKFIKIVFIDILEKFLKFRDKVKNRILLFFNIRLNDFLISKFEGYLIFREYIGLKKVDEV